MISKPKTGRVLLAKASPAGTGKSEIGAIITPHTLAVAEKDFRQTFKYMFKPRVGKLRMITIKTGQARRAILKALQTQIRTSPIKCVDFDEVLETYKKDMKLDEDIDINEIPKPTLLFIANCYIRPCVTCGYYFIKPESILSEPEPDNYCYICKSCAQGRGQDKTVEDDDDDDNDNDNNNDNDIHIQDRDTKKSNEMAK